MAEAYARLANMDWVEGSSMGGLHRDVPGGALQSDKERGAFIDTYLQKQPWTAEELAVPTTSHFQISAHYIGSVLKLVDKKEVLFTISEALPRIDVREKVSRRGGSGGSILLYASHDDGTPHDAPAEPVAHGYRGSIDEAFQSPGVMPRGVVVFDFGAVVMVGLKKDTEHEIVDTLTRLGNEAADAIKIREGELALGRVRGAPGHLAAETEDFVVDIRPAQHTFSMLKGNTLRLQTMDVDSVRVVATALAQSVAMDHYARLIDNMMVEFERLSIRLQAAGGKFNIPKKKLFTLVAETNLAMIDVVRNIGLMERSEPAWREERYDHLWEAVRKDLELIDRFTTLKLKVQMIQDSSKVYLDILNNKRSDMLEVIIVVLIALETVVMLLQIGVDSGAIASDFIKHPGQSLLRGILIPAYEAIRGRPIEPGSFLWVLKTDWDALEGEEED